MRSGLSLKLHLPHAVIVKAPGLLPMLYRLGELAEELEISPRVVREWMDKGLPYTRDAHGHLWINGQQFAEWVNQLRYLFMGLMAEDNAGSADPSTTRVSGTD